MESNQLDTPELFSAARNPVNDHLHYPTAADEHSVERTLLVQATERPLHCDKIYVGNLPPDVSMLGPLLLYKISLTNLLTRVDLHKVFKKFGQITDIQLPYNTGPGGKPKGYAFVMFNNSEVSRTTLCPHLAHRLVFCDEEHIAYSPLLFFMHLDACVTLPFDHPSAIVTKNAIPFHSKLHGAVDGYSMERLS